MEVFTLDDDDDDFVCSVEAAAPPLPTAAASKVDRKAVSLRKTTSMMNGKIPPVPTRFASDPLLKEHRSLPSASSSSALPVGVEENCPVCGKTLQYLNPFRRQHHLNTCLDKGEAKDRYQKKSETWKATTDCPVCATPLPPGPFRETHLKKCGKESSIPTRRLVDLVNTQERAADERRKRLLPHTKAKKPTFKPVKVPRLECEPRSLEEEDTLLARALSASLCEPPSPVKEKNEIRGASVASVEEEFEKNRPGPSRTLADYDPSKGISPVFTRIINENVRKRRSYAVVELAPRSCKCDVLQLVQSRFLRRFRVKTTTTRASTAANFEQHQARRSRRLAVEVQARGRLEEKLSRLDGLSWCMRGLLESGEREGDLEIRCSDGSIRAFSCLVECRTSLLPRRSAMAGKGPPSVSFPFPLALARTWLRFVYSADVEWTTADNETIKEIGQQFGPEGIVETCARLQRRKERKDEEEKEREEDKDEDIEAADGVVNESIPEESTEPVLGPPPSCDPCVNDPREPSSSKEKEPPVEENTLDDEDPLRGVGGEVAAPPLLSSSPVATKRREKEVHWEDSFLVALARKTPEKEISEEAVPHDVDPVVEMEGGVSMQEVPASPELFDFSREASSGRRSLTSLQSTETPRSRRRGSGRLIEEQEGEANGRKTAGDANQMVSAGVPLTFQSKTLLDEIIQLDSDDEDEEKDTEKERARVSPTRRRSPRQEIVILGMDEEKEDRGDKEMSTSVRDNVTADTEEGPSIRAELPSYGGGGSMEGGDEPIDFGYDNWNYGNDWDDMPGVVMVGGYDPMEENGEMNDGEKGGQSDGQEEAPTETRQRKEVAPPERAASPVDSFFDSVAFITVGKDAPGEEKGHRPGMGDILTGLTPMRKRLNEGKKGGGDEQEADRPPLKTPATTAPPRSALLMKSNVKVLKWSNITPRPPYETMDEAALKRECLRYGLRPMGKRKAVAALVDIYEQTHPVISPRKAASSSSSSGSSPVKKASPRKNKAAVREDDDEESASDGDDDLIRGDADDEGEEDGEGAAEESIFFPEMAPKTVDSMVSALLTWLRLPEQADLYTHCLALHPVSLEEMHIRIMRANSEICGIGRNDLMVVLDRLHITFSLKDALKKKIDDGKKIMAEVAKGGENGRSRGGYRGGRGGPYRGRKRGT